MAADSVGASSTTSVYAIDPLTDTRWPEFIQQHRDASVFHTRGWLQALKLTYGYEPVALTTSGSSAPLANALVCCLVRSWLTGDRLVSLPFSDHCEPLVDRFESFDRLMAFVDEVRTWRGWRYVEIRSADCSLDFGACFARSKSYCLHRLDLRPTVDALYQNFHKDCVQRKIRRAEREGLSYEIGRSNSLITRLYGLLCQTRSRHRLPPQPIEWFHNLITCMGDKACIRIASKDEIPLAGILTLSHGKKLVYKYGASDVRFNNLGGMALLFWETIREAREAGMESLDLGRSDLDNPGLITFKERWGATRLALNTWQSSSHVGRPHREEFKMQCAKEIFARMPERLSVLAGRLLYRHIG